MLTINKREGAILISLLEQFSFKIRQCKDRESNADPPATIWQEHGRGESLCEQDASSDSVGLQDARNDVPSVDVPSFSKNPRVQASRPQG